MRENVLDVLMYLFENYVYTEEESAPDRDSLQVQLLEAGFPISLVEKALDWLDGLQPRRARAGQSHRAPLAAFQS